MTRYILIDHHSGFVWGETEADSPIKACQQIDRSLGEYDRDYDAGWESRNWGGTYYVHEAPADFPEVTDGQDDDQIRAVTALPLRETVYYRRTVDL